MVAMSNAVEKFIDGLMNHGHAPRKNGKGWMSRCPGHEDRTPSLSVSEGNDGRALVKCHAGCSLDEILRPLGISKSDLFEQETQSYRPPRPPQSTNGSATSRCFEYRDEKGELLYRQWHKGKAERPDGQGGWVQNLDGVRRVPYRLQETLAALATNATLHVVEGEPDVESITELGLAATCNPNGAGKWRDEYTAHFSRILGLRVRVLADNDEPGRKHAEDVARSFHVAGVADVRVTHFPELPAKGDVSDWLRLRRGRGLTKGQVRAELVALAEGPERWAPPGEPVVTRLSAIEPRRLSWFWKHRIPRDMVTILAGHGGLGKSTLMLDLASRASTGRPMPDGNVGDGKPSSVVLFTSEDALDSVIVPRLMLAGADRSRIVTIGVRTGEGDARPLMVTPADLMLLERTVRSEGATLVIYDPIVAYVAEDVNLHHAQDARRILAWLHRLAERLGIAVVGIHHWNKSQSPEPAMRLSGSAAIGQAARSTLLVGPDPEDDG